MPSLQIRDLPDPLHRLLQRRASLGEHGAKLLPNGRFTFLRVGVIGGDAHRLAVIDGDRTQDGTQDLRDRDDAGR